MLENYVLSTDGIKIFYYSKGTGPALIIVPGSLSLAKDYERLSTSLSQFYTVHIIERRGHGKSGPQGNNYSIAKECEDLIAVQRKTATKIVVGHSFGGLIALETAHDISEITNLVVYEPGVSIDNSIPIKWADSFQAKLKQLKPLDAFIIFIKAMNPSARKTPMWLLRIILPKVVGKAKLHNIYSMLDSCLNEHEEVAKLDNTNQKYKDVLAKTMVLYGGKSQKTTKIMSEILVKTIPNATIKEFEKLDHFGIEEKSPEEVAEYISSSI